MNIYTSETEFLKAELQRLRALVRAQQITIDKLEAQQEQTNTRPYYTIDELNAWADEKEKQAWRNAAIRIGEELSSVGPDGYYEMDAWKWLDWAMEQEPRGKNSLAQPEQEPVTKDQWLMENAQGDLERIKLVQTGVGIGKPEPCQCPNCKVTLHASDCAVHSGPAYPKGECNCGAQQYNATSDHQLMENAQGDLERIKLVQTGVGISKPDQEPVAELLKQSRANFERNFGKDGQVWADWIYGDIAELLSEHTTPPQRKPLMDEEISDIVIEMNGNEPTALFWRDLAKAIEAAHGIKGEA